MIGLAAGSREGTVYVWNFQNPEEPTLLTGHTDYVTFIGVFARWQAVSERERATTPFACGVLKSGEQIATLPSGRNLAHLWEIAFSPCGELIAGGMDDEICLWCADQLTTYYTQYPQPEEQPTGRMMHLAFSPCGKYLASGTWWQQGMEKMAIRLWDVATAENIHTFWGHTTDVQSLAFSPDGNDAGERWF